MTPRFCSRCSTSSVVVSASAETVLGIDPGSRTTGYTILRTDPLALVQCGVLKLPPRKVLNDRLALLSEDLAELFEEFHPSMLAIETAHLGPFPQAAIVLSEVRGMVKGFAFGRGIRVLEFAPAVVKRVATGRGNATKPQVRTAIMHRLGLRTPPPLDASDSAAIALCGVAHHLRR